MKRIISMAACFAAGLWISVHAACTPVDVAWPLSSQESFDQLDTIGENIWYFHSSYGAVASTYAPNVTAWLITPAVDLRDALAVSFAFSHTHRYAGTPENELTLWVCAEYDGPETAEWNQLTIPSYNNEQLSWSWKDNSITVPVSMIGSKTVFGFRYTTTDDAHAQWEIKNVHLESMCPGGTGGDTPNGRMRVCGQNMRNYYINYDNSNSTRANYDHAAFAAKTAKIVKSFLKINADIYAMCEIEACHLVLTQLADSLNKYLGENRYAAVSDGIDVEWDSYDNNMKSGFLYRVDKVQPFGSNTAASTYQYYRNTMRIQGFQEISSGEKFVLSMNHFKAKTGGGDQGESTRITNSEHLVNALKKSLGDPDILIMGDLNCEVDETPIVNIINAGFAEQLLRFDPEAYSHCYGGEGSLIDHALANSSMAKQVKSAQLYHNCTTNCGIDNYATSYSDHDPYVVDITLGADEQGMGNTNGKSLNSTAQKIIINGRLFILLENGEMYDITGKRVQK